MKALVRLSDTPRDFALREVPEPQLRPGTIKVRVRYVGICGSDLHIYLGYEPGLPQGVHGHEFSGVVAEIGEGVTGFAPGDRVTVEHTHSTCGRCAYCRTGRYQLCEQRHSLGFDIQGAFTEYVVVDPRYAHKLPPNLDDQKGALTEPLACIVHAIRLIDVRPALRVLVIGPGTMGLLCGLTLKAHGCTVDILGTPQDAQRLALAEASGLRPVDAEEAKKNRYPVIADCSGSGGGIRLALELLPKGGTLLQVGISTEPVTLPYEQVVYKELKIQGTFCHVWEDWEQALRLQEANLLDVAPVITRVVPLEDWQQAFEQLLDKNGMKTLIRL